MVKNDVTVVARSRKIAIAENRASKRTGPSLGSLGGSRRRQDVSCLLLAFLRRIARSDYVPPVAGGRMSDAGWNTM
jgi:hypothetical protein